MTSTIHTSEQGNTMTVQVYPSVGTRHDLALYRAVLNAGLLTDLEAYDGQRGNRWQFTLDGSGSVVAKCYLGNRTLEHAELLKIGEQIQAHAEKIVGEIARIEHAMYVIREARKENAP